MFGGCQICKGGDHLATTCSRLNEPQPKCAKCDMPHRTKNYGIKCTFCTSLSHYENKCWKKPKDGKSHSGATNFLDVLLNDEDATMQQLNNLCRSENLFSYTRMPRRRIHVDVALGGVVPTLKVAGDGTSVSQDTLVKSKILAHFIKGKIFLSHMETIIIILGELEHLESLVRVR